MKKINNQIYILKKDDTLKSIALKYNCSEVSILIANNVTPSLFHEKKIIFIPTSS